MEIVKCVKQINIGPRNSYTLIHLVDIFKGKKVVQTFHLFHAPTCSYNIDGVVFEKKNENLRHVLIICLFFAERNKVSLMQE